jgi:hypothetical protein
VIWNDGELVAPAAMVTLGGTLASAGSDDDSVTVVALVAAPFSATVPLLVAAPPTTVAGVIVSAFNCNGPTVSVAVFVTPSQAAEITTDVEAAAAVVVIGNVAD